MARPAAQEARRSSWGQAATFLLADRERIVFIASTEDQPDRAVRRADRSVVIIPLSAEELRGTEVVALEDGSSPSRVVPRPDLLSPALARLISREHRELTLQPGHDGLKAALVTAQDDEQPFPVAPKDAAGFLAAVLQIVPQGVVHPGSGRIRRVLVRVCPGMRRHEYRLGLAGVVGSAAPAALGEIGLSPSALQILLEVIERPTGLLLIAGGPSSGRSTTLDLVATTLLGRGRRGARIGPRAAASLPDLAWLAEALQNWPFPESLLAALPDFVLVDHVDGGSDLLLAARLAACGTFVLAGAPAADSEALLRSSSRRLDDGSVPAVPLAVLGQTLVRTICRRCAAATTLPAAALRRCGLHPRDLEEMERRGGLPVVRGPGCVECAGTGAAGLTGVFDLAAPEDVAASLPRLREEGWRKVLQREACFEDVAMLPAARRPMRTFRELLVLSGCGALPLDDAAHPILGAQETGGLRDVAPAGSAGVQGDRPMVAECATFTGLLAAARAAARGHRGRSDGPPDDALARELQRLTRAVAARATGPEPLQALLVPARGFRLDAHAFNTALIAARLSTRLGPEVDPVAAVALALVHDLGLVRAIEPDAELPPVLFEEEIDPAGARLRPGDLLALFGPETGMLEPAIVAIHDLLQVHPAPSVERGRPMTLAQVVAIAGLMDLRLNGPQEHRAADLSEATSIIMEQHGRTFSRDVLRALLKSFPIFPIGALVELSSGDLARVVSLNDDNHFRPRVEISAAPDGDAASERRVVDLARAPFLHIRQRLTQAAGADRGQP